jgi:hypothetical protein
MQRLLQLMQRGTTRVTSTTSVAADAEAVAADAEAAAADAERHHSSDLNYFCCS